jgi:hypothetical protein
VSGVEVVNFESEDVAWAELDDDCPLPDGLWRDLMALPPGERDQQFRDLLSLGRLPWQDTPGALDRVEAARSPGWRTSSTLSARSRAGRRALPA